MPEYLSPGVYIEEQDTGPEPIEGVSTSVTGFVGVTQRGPLDTLPPVLVTSFPEFIRIFGGYFTPSFSGAAPTPSSPWPYNLLPHAVAGFFNNGGKHLYIKRVAANPPPPYTLGSVVVINGSPSSGSYQVGDVLTIAGGTTSNAATIQVAAVSSSGAITSVTVLNAGSYTVNPSLTPNTPGAGSLSGVSGATFNLTMLPTPALSATASEGLQNNVATPQIVTYLTASAGSSQLTLSLESLRGIVHGSTITLTQVKNGVTTAGFANVDSYNDANGSVTLATALAAKAPNALPTVFYPQCTTVSVTNGAFTVKADGPPSVVPPYFALSAANPGAWGNNIELEIQPSSRAMAQVISIAASLDVVVLNSTANFYVGAIVEFNRGTTKVYKKVSAILGSSIQVTQAFAATTDLDPNGGASPTTTARTCEFDVFASYGTVSESFQGLTLDDSTRYYYATAINNGSTLLAVPPVSPANAAHPYPCDNNTTDPSTLPMAIDGLNVPMAAGTDGGFPSANDYVGNDGGPGNRTGLAALIDVDQISIIAVPGVTDPATQGALIAQCETLKYRFAILDPNPIPSSSVTPLSAIQTQRLLFDTKYAAIYFPSLIVGDPLTDNNLTVPPSGHMAGIYAQTDDSRGVWKAPANVVINSILGLEVKLNKADQDILNPEPNNINALRDFTAQGRGLRVYGARCITSDEEWKYISVRRLFIFLEASLDQGTQWAVFEPNDQRLWNRLIQSVSAFLTTVWREGGLMGATADQAFFVKCGYDTMSQDDIDNGRLIMEVGVAPVFPAEFVIIRIGQWAGGSSVQEL